MNVEDGVGPLRLAVDPAQDVPVRFNGIAVEQLIEEPAVKEIGLVLDPNVFIFPSDNLPK